MTKLKKITFQLEVTENFNPYKFFQIFKRIQAKGFFKDIIRVSKLDEKEKAVELIIDEKDIENRDEFLRLQKYGVK